MLRKSRNNHIWFFVKTGKLEEEEEEEEGDWDILRCLVKREEKIERRRYGRSER